MDESGSLANEPCVPGGRAEYEFNRNPKREQGIVSAGL